MFASYKGALECHIEKHRSYSIMAVEVLERATQETQLSNRDNIRRIYSNACLLDSQNIDEEAMRVVKQYTSNADEINSYERVRFRSLFSNNGENSRVAYENSTQAEERHNNLMQYLDAGRLPADFRLFRGTSLEHFCDAIIFGQIDNSIFLNDCKNINDGNELTEKYKGQVFTYGQYISASVKIEAACDFLDGPTQCLLNISAPKGALARCIGNISECSTEDEVLFPSGTQFRIVEIRPREKIKDIYVEVVVDKAAKNSYDAGNEY